MTNVSLPLNDVQLSLLKLSDSLRESEMQDLKKIIIAYKAHRLALLADKIWDEKGWSQQTMDVFLNTHMRTPYKDNKPKIAG
jgi:hypothetical protein